MLNPTLELLLEDLNASAIGDKQRVENERLSLNTASIGISDRLRDIERSYSLLISSLEAARSSLQ